MSQGTPTRLRSSQLGRFWRRLSDGIAIHQLWLQLNSEARASYRWYSSEVDFEPGKDEKPLHRWWRVISGLFWAMVLKLSPARRVLFVIALVMLPANGMVFEYRSFRLEVPDLAIFGSILLVILLALELADRVTMKRDLEIAKEIQTWLMPTAPPQVPGIEMAFATRPANTVAGDYYDAFLRTNAPNRTPGSIPSLLFAMADVAGKSVPAALLMATLQASLRTLADVCADPVELTERLNRYCCEQNVGGQRFTTAFLAELDTQTRKLTYINAGHNWPVLRRASGAIERLEVGGVPLGLLRGAKYAFDQVVLGQGDLLVVFTDGLVEAEDDHEEQYGEPRMLAAIESARGGSAEAALRILMGSADRFTGTAPQHDDITCLVLRVT